MAEYKNEANLWLLKNIHTYLYDMYIDRFGYKLNGVC